MIDLEGEGPPRIVIADDNASVRQQLVEVLTGPPLHAEVRVAETGIGALKEALTWTDVDCVVSDLEMPSMNGIELLRNIRQRLNRLELPVLLLTSTTDVRRKVEAFDNGASDFVGKPFEPAELLARVQSHVHLARMHRQLTTLANTDTLTGLSNRRRFEEIFSAETLRAGRLKRAFGLVLLDIDHFKAINDEHGHPEGDAVLSSMGALLRKSHRVYDHLGRLGGEEFGVLLPEVSQESACIVAERIRSLVAGSALGSLPKGRVTVSLGVVHATGDGVTETDDLYRRADVQLYQAKEGGRNRWCCEDAVLRAVNE